MKKLLESVLIASMILFTACSGEYVVSRPADVNYVRPDPPGPEYIWIDGDWIWEGGVYHWHEGHWDKRVPNREWRAGHWKEHKGGWRWNKGRWE